MTSNFNKFPVVKVQGEENSCLTGWENIVVELNRRIRSMNKKKTVVTVECYQGVDDEELFARLLDGLHPEMAFRASDAYLSENEITEKTLPDVTNDRIFGFMTRLNIDDFFDSHKIEKIQNDISNQLGGLIFLYGTGASLLFPKSDLLVYADMARWEIQQRMRRNEVSNIGINNAKDSSERQYKIGYFVDWRVCDRLKKKLIDKWDYVLDSNRKGHPKMVSGDALRKGLKQTVKQPFSVVPYFDAGPWGGQWMKKTCGLDKSKENYAWCINCIPEENSLYLSFGVSVFETPSVNVVLYQAVALLGDAVHARFGDEFPIRFDFLDTFDGGNLSLQVHPLTEYIQEKFGMHYTQDESYYILDAKNDASVYLGLKESIVPEEMINELMKAEKEGVTFQDSKFIEKWPAKKHDHFLIPGGTIHCSGKNSLVLEISATPYIFTFKLWDWGRLGLDGKPRPINIEHGKNVIQWNRTTSWTKKNLINRIELLAEGDGWNEEKTGLHIREFIETRRHWFSKKVEHNTNGGVNVLNLVEGTEAIVESASHAFEPFVVHYAETFIVPATVGEYTIRPFGASEGKQCATIKAFVRTNS